MAAADKPTPELYRQTQLKVAHNPADYETKQVRKCRPSLHYKAYSRPGCPHDAQQHTVPGRPHVASNRPCRTQFSSA